MKKATMRDIGKACGVSAVTVSKALAGKSGMSEKVRDRILKTAEEMDYQYPGNEKIRPRRNLDIGILIPEKYFSPESFYSVMYKRLVRKLAEEGHFGLLELLTPESDRELTLPHLISSRHVDGMILLGQPGRDYYRMLAAQGTPVVFLDFYDEQGCADCVVGDNTYGCYRLTNHLIRNGHTEIGFVGNVHATSSIMDRYLGYYRAMLGHRLPVRDEWVLSDREDEGSIREFELPGKLPTAFVCNCDLVAYQLIRMLAERGIRVPEDVSVVGFDDYCIGRKEEIGLSTFRVDTESMIELAVKTVTDRCSGQQKPFGRTVVGGQPVYRESETARK